MSRDFRIKSKSISFLIYQEREREGGRECEWKVCSSFLIFLRLLNLQCSHENRINAVVVALLGG